MLSNAETAPEGVVELPIAAIERGYYQPREYFDSEAMEATRRSIQEKGQKYPVIVRPILLGNPLFDPQWEDLHYELADGERRYRCCKELGYSTLKALVRQLSDEEMLDYTLTTNDSMPLNPIEKAMVFSRLAKEFGKSQAEVAKSFNLKQQQVSEYIRLLDLPKEIQDLTARAVISVRHARELLKIQDSEKMKELALDVKNRAISTRELVKIVKNDKKKPIERQETDSERAESTFALRQDAILGENRHPVSLSWLEGMHFRLIPASIYEKLEYWLSFELGSTLKPEAWLLRAEIALVIGMLLASLAVWLPIAVLAGILGLFASLIFFLYIS